MVWLQYELAVPLAMAALIFLIVPARQMGVVSIYEIPSCALAANRECWPAAVSVVSRRGDRCDDLRRYVDPVAVARS